LYPVVLNVIDDWLCMFSFEDDYLSDNKLLFDVNKQQSYLLRKLFRFSGSFTLLSIIYKL
jgi:hypothetical protein